MTNNFQLPFSPAAERNSAPILAVLKQLLLPGSSVLEIGAGTGQHAVAFSQSLSGVFWQSTEQRRNLAGLNARIALEGGPDLPEAIALEVGEGEWPAGPFDAVYTANTVHIMSWTHVCDMVAGVSGVLEEKGLFIVYGPFMIDGAHTAPSNEAFDIQLRQANPAQGIREVGRLESEAAHHQLRLKNMIEMPANNFMAIFEHQTQAEK